MKILKIISGGQTGADQGGLDAAIASHLPHGGKCPAGRRSEDGPIPHHYKLEEVAERNYKVRTEANVVDSDATFIFSKGTPKTGSKLTIQYCKKHNKPWIHIDVAETDFFVLAAKINQWLSFHSRDMVINIAGSRESSRPGIQRLVMNTMICVIDAHKPEKV
jgi:hypothetical protein